jgi:triacylglycerol lipase
MAIVTADMQNTSHILLIHGIFNSGRCFQKMQWHLEESGYTVHCPTLTPNFGIASLPELTSKVEHYIQEHIPENSSVHLIGYSMGGLICRHFLQQQNDLQRYLSLTTLATPHNGSLHAWLLPLPGLLDMRQQSEFIAELEENDHRIAQHCRPLSLWTPLDLMILPQNSSVWHIAENEQMLVSMHPNMIRAPKVLDRVTKHVKESDPFHPNSPKYKKKPESVAA